MSRMYRSFVPLLLLSCLLGGLLLPACGSANPTPTPGAPATPQAISTPAALPSAPAQSATPIPAATSSVKGSATISASQPSSSATRVADSTDTWLSQHQTATIVYTRSGGIAGLNQGWAFYADGRIVARDGKEGTVPSTAISDRLARAEQVGFFQWRDSYIDGSVCCDRFTYQLTIRNAAQSKTVTTIDGTTKEPEELRPLLGQLDTLVRDAGLK